MREAHKNDVYLLLKMLDEEVATVHIPTLDVELTVLPSVDVETPFQIHTTITEL